MKNSAGFSLIELLVVVAIIGIVASVAYPTYQGYTQTTRRADGRAALTTFANDIEHARCTRNNCNSYLGLAVGGADTGAPDPGVSFSRFPVTGNKIVWNLSIQAATADTFILQAVAVDADPLCGTMTIDDNGVGAPAACW